MAQRKSTAKTGRTAVGGTDHELESRDATLNADKFVKSQLNREIMNVLWLPAGLTEDQREERALSAIVMLQTIKPQGGIEGMLAAQMVATHSAAMECFRRAMIKEQSFEGRDQNLKHGVKLLSVYMRQVEVLDKHRGKGQQKVTVEHVHVESGGQAIVGNVGSGGARPRRKRKSPPGPKSIAHEPRVPMDNSTAARTTLLPKEDTD